MRAKRRPSLRELTLAIVFASMAGITAVQGFLTYGRVYDRIQEGFDRKLLAISTVTAAFFDGEDHRQIMAQKNEDSALYRRYVEPMRRIRERKDVTYLYTQIPTGGDRIVYGVDGTVGKEHSPIGSVDAAPAGEIDGIVSVYRQGGSYLSGMRVWQQWGLLKSAYMPIRAPEGAITAMAGTDVNISAIKPKTMIALLIVIGCGLLFLGGAGYVSAHLVRRVTDPLSRLKGTALQVAAGRYGLEAAITSPSELADLAGAFNRLSRSLERRLQDIRQINATVEQQRRERLLLQALQRRDLTASPPAASGLQLMQLPTAAACADASGWVRWQNHLLLWAGPSEPDPLAAARTRHDVALVLQAVLHRHATDWPALAGRLEALFAGRLGGYLLLDLEADRCLWLARGCPAPRLLEADTPLAAGSVATLPPDRWLAWCSRAALTTRLPALVAAGGARTGVGGPPEPCPAPAGAEAGEAAHGLVLLWRTGQFGHPVAMIRARLQRANLIETHFAGLAKAELDLLCGGAQLEKRAPGDRLTLQGEHPTLLYLVLAGRVRIDARQGPIELTGAYWIGEFSVMYGGAANATCTALTPLECLVWDRTPLAVLLSENPGLERAFRGVLASAMAAKLRPPSHPS